MTNTTPEFWAVDGVSIQTYAYNITSWGGSRQSPPPVRGENTVVPFAQGRKWTPKIADSRIVSLSMSVIGSEPDGSVPDSARVQFEANWRMLRQLLFTPRRQFELSKQIRDPISGLWVKVVALAEYSTGLDPVMLGTSAAQFSVDIELADPYFYSADAELIEFTSAEATQEFLALGEDRTVQEIVTFFGPLTGPQIENQTVAGGSVTIGYTGTIGDGDRVDIDVADFSAVYTPASGSPYKVTGLIIGTGDVFWMVIDPGQTKLVFSATTGTGSAQLTYKPGWI